MCFDLDLVRHHEQVAGCCFALLAWRPYPRNLAPITAVSSPHPCSFVTSPPSSHVSSPFPIFALVPPPSILFFLPRPKPLSFNGPSFYTTYALPRWPGFQVVSFQVQPSCLSLVSAVQTTIATATTGRAACITLLEVDRPFVSNQSHTENAEAHLRQPQLRQPQLRQMDV